MYYNRVFPFTACLLLFVGCIFYILWRNLTRRKTLLFIILFFLSIAMISTPITTSSTAGKAPKVLVVCSDVEDVMFANSLELGNFSVDIIYLGKDLPGDRSKLSDLAYLLGYDEVWIPDLNTEWTIGGRLTDKEVHVLSEYVRRGGVLIIGLNTYVQSWSRFLEGIVGSRILRIELSKNFSSDWYIVYKDKIYPYNITYQAVIVSVYRGEVVARYRNGYPAIIFSKYGDGVGALMTFNPVIAFVEGYSNLTDLYLDIGLKALKERTHPPQPLSMGEKIMYSFEKYFFIIILIFLFIIFEIMGYLGLLPLGITIISAIPLLPFSRILMKRRIYREIIKTVETFKGVEISDLSEEVGVKIRRIKFPLAILFLRRLLNIINLRDLGDKVLIVLRRYEDVGVASWSLKTYPALMNLIINNPGITILDLARRLHMPPHEVSRILNTLSQYGVVEVRKIGAYYEVYPLNTLLRCSRP